ncbi:MAG: hypothetical protein AAF222_10100 [Pseudomonadota bacterium]
MNALLAVLAALLGATGLSGGSSGDGGTTTSASAGASDPGGTSSGSNNAPSSDASETLAALSAPEDAFFAADGQLVLEAESGTASGHWQAKMVDGEMGMLWDAESNSYNRAQDDEALSFEFVTEEAGRYYIAVHGGRVASAMDPEDVRSDTGNDAFYRVTNLETGEVILDPTKLFIGLGSADEELKWGKTFDKNHVKSDAQVQLDADTAYRLDLIGRSDGHVVDRVTLSKDGFLRDTEVEESAALMEALTMPFIAESEIPVVEDEEEVVELF